MADRFPFLDKGLDRASILPVAMNEQGERVLAVPGLLATALEAAALPADVYEGLVDPVSEEGIERSADLAGAVTGAPVGGPAGAVAMGGARRALPLHTQVRRYNENFGEIVQRAQTDNNFLDIRYVIGRDIKSGANPETVARIDFNVNNASGSSASLPNIPRPDAFRFLATVEKSLDRFLDSEQIDRLTFQAARTELDPLYSRIVNRVAKERGGIVTKSTPEGQFEIVLPTRGRKPTAAERARDEQALAGSRVGQPIDDPDLVTLPAP